MLANAPNSRGVNKMICAITSVAFGMYPFGVMYKACIYRCPIEKSAFYYHYPKVIRTSPEGPCPAYVIVGRSV